MKILKALLIMLLLTIGSSAYAQGQHGGSPGVKIYKKQQSQGQVQQQKQQNVQEEIKNRFENRYHEQKQESYQNSRQIEKNIHDQNRYQKNIRMWDREKECWIENGRCTLDSWTYRRNSRYQYND